MKCLAILLSMWMIVIFREDMTESDKAIGRALTQTMLHDTSEAESKDLRRVWLKADTNVYGRVICAQTALTTNAINAAITNNMSDPSKVYWAETADPTNGIDSIGWQIVPVSAPGT